MSQAPTDNINTIDQDLSIDLYTFQTQEFSGKLLVSAFHQSPRKSSHLESKHDDISLKEYLLAYNQVIKFLEKLGTVFYFVITDIREKIQILENHIEEKPDHYETIQKMVEYEKREKHLVKKQEKPNNGARTILRLHRALIFIYKLLNNLYAADMGSRSSDICVTAYDETLAQYHTWLIKKAARFGMRMMPTREVIISYMSSDESEIEKFPGYISSVLTVYDITQDIYERHQILDLP